MDVFQEKSPETPRISDKIVQKMTAKVLNRPKQYRKSWAQRKKEQIRRDRVLALFTEDTHRSKEDIARTVGCTRSTVYRDLNRMRRRVRIIKLRELAKFYMVQLERKQMISQMPLKEQIRVITSLLKKPKLRPRGMSFSSSYQPRWGKKHSCPYCRGRLLHHRSFWWCMDCNRNLQWKKVEGKYEWEEYDIRVRARRTREHRSHAYKCPNM